MDRFGFEIKWRGWIMECLSTARVSILVNGSPMEEFAMGKGLTQGDPLSPFLFLMVGEGLHGLVQKSKRAGLLHGLEIGQRETSISLFQFVVDTVIIVQNLRVSKLWGDIIRAGGKSLRLRDMLVRGFRWELVGNKEGVARDMGKREREGWRWNMEWRRKRIRREQGEEQGDKQVLWEVLDGIQIKEGVEDC
ncbi:hypothetical protein SLEP1_g42775 [Rubroshorea leprosula]|uniref:Reverse transcriptase domain-containing protein n=1 Tax=Rubroshorea leprosula TaxID=152421 RepID=A0AAV5LAZ7_9ROSI|nr:hypothetical protein SLEP1_g42775 [Rubroshorea leprosula]